jgi:signal transduction histidine kinase
MLNEESLKSLIHDLRNPLNSISVSAELAKLQISAGKNPNDVLVSLDRILNECRNCSHILEGVHD